ncbi:hypothetical protein SAMN05216565_10527 [Litchfieldia salsa]|uniref:Uncharacterized protein n=1 Tax=Litchfieldia salsa TaxID=930152 RepID=A0A1H0ULT4_9BACI|nr:hypothetical protein SAMN05216565_10527 [Litchfieldia salsa]
MNMQKVWKLLVDYYTNRGRDVGVLYNHSLRSHKKLLSFNFYVLD